MTSIQQRLEKVLVAYRDQIPGTRTIPRSLSMSTALYSELLTEILTVGSKARSPLLVFLTEDQPPTLNFVSYYVDVILEDTGREEFIARGNQTNDGQAYRTR